MLSQIDEIVLQFRSQIGRIEDSIVSYSYNDNSNGDSILEEVKEDIDKLCDLIEELYY